MYIKYWKSMEIPQLAIFYWNFVLYRWWQFWKYFALCSMNKILEKWREVMELKFLNLVLKIYWISMENSFRKMCGNPVTSSVTFALPRFGISSKQSSFAEILPQTLTVNQSREDFCHCRWGDNEPTSHDRNINWKRVFQRAWFKCPNFSWVFVYSTRKLKMLVYIPSKHQLHQLHKQHETTW